MKRLSLLVVCVLAACGAPVEVDGGTGGAAAVGGGTASGGGSAGGAAVGGGSTALGGGASVGGGAATGGGSMVDIDPLAGIGAVVTIDAGFGFLEGPVWLSDAGVLLFSDIPNNHIYRYDPAASGNPFTIFRANSGNSNGLGFDPQGRLLAADHGNRRVSRTDSTGTITTVADRYDGGKLNSPNDLIAKSDGTIFFTDPPYGVPSGQQRELSFQGVFRVSPTGVLSLLAGDMTAPNGVGLSPDEQTLYVSDSEDSRLRIYSLLTDGGVSSPTIVPTTQMGGSGGDGLVLDDFGNVYLACVGPGQVKVYRPDGGFRGRVLVPQNVTNVSFGGADRQTLYITAGTGLYSVRLNVAGKP